MWERLSREGSSGFARHRYDHHVPVLSYRPSLLRQGHGPPEQRTESITVPAVDVWPVLSDERFRPDTPTLDRLNDAALTLASMLITLDEYKIMRLAILSQ